MLTKLTLAALAGLILQVAAAKQPVLAAAPQKIDVFLCKTEAQTVVVATASWTAPVQGAQLAGDLT